MPKLDLTEAEIADILSAFALIGVQGGVENIVRIGALLTKLQPYAPKKPVLKAEAKTG